MAKNNKNPDLSKYKFNIVSHRGDPKKATLDSGHEVEKSEFLYFKTPDDGSNPDGVIEEGFAHVKAAEYHGEHFLYIDPLYETEEGKGHWFAMCTCGSPAVIVAAAELNRLGLYHGETEQMAVCMFYTSQVADFGVLNAKHQTSYINRAH